MHDSDFRKRLRRWFTFGRLVPLITILVAAAVTVLGILDFFQVTIVEGVTIAILTLLAVDALTERMTLLEKIEYQLSNLPSGSLLKPRTELPPLRERGRTASEIVMVGVSLISAVTPNLDFFEHKMKEGCRMRFLLLDPNSPSMATWNLMNKVPDSQADIATTLKTLEVLLKSAKTNKSKCEIRLSNTFLPFGLAAFDPSKDSGFMNVEYYTYKGTLGERPHIQLKRAKDAKWFEFYKSQYEQLWAEAVKWNPSSAS